MKKIEIEVPDGHRAEWVNGVLTLVDEKPIEYKFKVGDKVIFPLFSKDKAMTITEQLAVNGCPCYNLKSYNNIYIRGEEDEIFPYIPQDITERIKTFDDAEDWCSQNKPELCRQWRNYCNAHDDDVEAYLKLRIITAALNEGWEPTFEKDELRYYSICDTDGEALRVVAATKRGYITPYTLYFKTRDLAEYAATQFADIYADICGIKKTE